MIRRISGKISELSVDRVLIDTNSGISFEIQIHPRLFKKLKTLTETSLKVRLIIKENFYEIYAFDNDEEEELFLLLEKIYKIGPKIAYNILRCADVKTIKQKVHEKDVSFFQQVPQVGKKSAQKIVLELLEKIDKKSKIKDVFRSPDDELLYSALKNLGFKKDQIQKVISEVNFDLPLEEKIKEALKKLSG